MYQGYVLRVFVAYLFILGAIMLLRTHVFLVQLQALAQEPALLFNLGFIGLIMGLSLVLATSLTHLARFLGLMILLKSGFVLAFPFQFAQGLVFFANPKWVEGVGIFFLIFGFNLWIYQRYFLGTKIRR